MTTPNEWKETYTSEGLHACPHCGSKARYVQVLSANPKQAKKDGLHWIECTNICCPAIIGPRQIYRRDGIERDKQLFFKAWNELLSQDQLFDRMIVQYRNLFIDKLKTHFAAKMDILLTGTD